MKNNKKVIAAIIFVSFAISIAYSFYFQIAPAVDAAAYDRIAGNLVQGNGYKEDAGLPYDKDLAILRVGPGYQFFLSAVYYIFGRNLQIVWILNAFLHAFSALFVYFLSREIFKNHWNEFLGTTAAVFIGFSPDLITMSGMLMTETLGVFLIAVASFIFFKYINSAGKPVYLVILFSAVFGFAIMTRTPAVLLALPVLCYFFINKQWRNILVFGVVLIALFSPWVVRNYGIYNAFIPTNYAFGYDLLVGNHPGASGELEPYQPAERYIEDYDRVEGNDLALRDAVYFITAHPLEFLKITFYRISIYFSLVRPTGFWFHLEGLSRALTLGASALYALLLFGFGFRGIFRVKTLDYEDKNRARILFWMLAMMPLAVIGILVETRYRFLSYPFFAVFAAFGLSAAAGLRNELRFNFGPFLAVWGFLFANAAYDAFRNMDRIVERFKELL